MEKWDIDGFFINYLTNVKKRCKLFKVYRVEDITEVCVMEKNIHVSMLLEIYGKLLTQKQYDVVDFYYNQNLSLAEIAESENITRQGVRKNLVDAENKLFDYEEKLQLLKKKLQRAEIIEELLEKTEDVTWKEKLQMLF